MRTSQCFPTKDMKPEILLKAYVQYQSEDAFRDLVASTLDVVYSTSLRIVHGVPYLAGEITVSAYSELARRAPGLSENIELTSWLRESTCKMAVRVLRTEDRDIDWAALKRERSALATPADVQPAPPGLAIRICQSIFLTAARHKRRRLFLPRVSWPAWLRPMHVGAVAACVLVIIAWRNNPFRRHNPIVRSQGTLMTPSSFAQLAGPGDLPGQMANTNPGTNTNQK